MDCLGNGYRIQGLERYRGFSFGDSPFALRFMNPRAEEGYMPKVNGWEASSQHKTLPELTNRIEVICPEESVWLGQHGSRYRTLPHGSLKAL